jgi:putative transposase
MPSKNRVKQYLPNSVYHVYNRGVEKRIIFQGADDFTYFISCLKQYTAPRDDLIREMVLRHRSRAALNSKLKPLLRMPLYEGRIKILAFSLIPNHFHLLIKQREIDGMQCFMKSLGVKYAMYFNNKNHRVGSLFQDIYKARLIKTKADLLRVSKYVHRNQLGLSTNLEEYPWASFQYYSHKKIPNWIHQNEVLDAFARSAHYKKYKSYFDYVKDQP